MFSEVAHGKYYNNIFRGGCLTNCRFHTFSGYVFKSTQATYKLNNYIFIPRFIPATPRQNSNICPIKEQLPAFQRLKTLLYKWREKKKTNNAYAPSGKSSNLLGMLQSRNAKISQLAFIPPTRTERFLRLNAYYSPLQEFGNVPSTRSQLMATSWPT